MVDTFKDHNSFYVISVIKKRWRDVRVTFIEKTGRRPSEEAKSYRPISLTSFRKKKLRLKIVDNNIRKGALKDIPLRGN